MVGKEDDGDDEFEVPDYGENSGYFTIKLWHSGQVVKRDGILEYWKGEFEFVDYCDVDKFSILELDAIVKEKLNYSVGAVYYVNVPGVDDLQYCETDAYLLKCLERCLVFSSVVEVFCSHPLNAPLKKGDPEVPQNSLFYEEEEAAQLMWHNDEEDDVENEDELEGDEEGLDNDFVDDDFQQSEDEVQDEATVEETLEEMFGQAHEKVPDLGVDDEYMGEDVDSESEEEFGNPRVPRTEEMETNSEAENDSRSTKHLPKLPEFRPTMDMENPVFELGMLFPSGACFREAVKQYGIKNGKDIYFKRNECNRVRAGCSRSIGCPWLLYAAKVNDCSDFQVRTFKNVHKCSRAEGNRFVSAKWLAQTYSSLLRSKKGWDVAEFVSQVKKDYVVDISVQKAYRARRLALELVEEQYKAQYKALWSYANEIKHSNPGSTVLIKAELGADGIPVFQRIYICYAACKEGFNVGCRKLVCLDGCHLKGPHKGILLCAIGVDANNSYFPIAFAVVEAECKDSWSWFLEILREDIGIYNSHHWSFMSDKQKGLEQALKDMWGSETEQAEHRHCARHVQANFTNTFKGQMMKHKMMAAAKSCTESEFKREMEDIRKEDQKAFDWLLSKGPSHWCKAFFRTELKCDLVLNNLCESFNGTTSILIAREKPILHMLERIRMYLLQRFTKQRINGTKWHLSIGPRISKILERNKMEAACNMPYWCGAAIYQVIDQNGSEFAINLDAKSCSCRKWELNGIPCCHAIACIWHKHLDPEAFVCDAYKKEAYAKTYAPQMMPIRKREAWPRANQTDMRMPMFKKQPGRPKKARRLEPDEVHRPGSTKMSRVYIKNHCKICHNSGHNSRTCPKKTSSSEASGRKSKRSKKKTQKQQPTQNNPDIPQPSRRSPRVKSVATKNVHSSKPQGVRTSPRFKTQARKNVNVESARRLFPSSGECSSSMPSQPSQVRQENISSV